MHETYRMLGREHELDLEREARNRQAAAALPKTRPEVASERVRRRKRRFVPRPLVAWLAR